MPSTNPKSLQHSTAKEWSLMKTQKLRPALFLHIQKTAGTSIQGMARKHYGNQNAVSHGDFAQLGVRGCQEKPFVSGHFGFEFAKRLRAGRFFSRFCVIRWIALSLIILTADITPTKISKLARRQGNMNWMIFLNFASILKSSGLMSGTTKCGNCPLDMGIASYLTDLLPGPSGHLKCSCRWRNATSKILIT